MTSATKINNARAPFFFLKGTLKFSVLEKDWTHENIVERKMPQKIIC